METDERKFLQEKFKAMGYGSIDDYGSISAFVRGVGSALSEETWGLNLKRGGTPRPGVLLTMCAELNCTADEVRTLLKNRGEEAIAGWIRKDSRTAEVEKLIRRIDEIEKDPKKLKVLNDMLDAMGPLNG